MSYVLFLSKDITLLRIILLDRNLYEFINFNNNILILIVASLQIYLIFSIGACH